MDFIPTDDFRLEIRIPFYEIDAGQALYHGNYFHLFETARLEHLRAAGFTYKNLMEMSRHLSLVDAHLRYRRPLLFDEEVVVTSAVVDIKTRSMTYEQKIFKKGQKKPATEATLTFVCTSFDGSAVHIPGELLDALAAYHKP